jgi:acetyltransferase-like isoleucine patch superfamily enzyme
VKLLRTALAALAFVRAILSIRFWSLVAHVRLRAHGATVGRRLRVRGPLRLQCHRTGVIRIGDDCRIQSGFAGNPVGGGQRLSIWVGPGGRLEIGDRVGLSNSTIVCMHAVAIEDDVFLGGDSKIYDTDFHSLDAAQRARPGNPGARTAAVHIGPRVFIGGHCVVLKGTTVGEQAVLGAGSVVRGTVPPREIWAGNPARKIRDLADADGRRARVLAAELEEVAE